MKSNIISLKKEKEVKKQEIKKKKLNYIDKLFIRIFLSSLILLTLISIEKTKFSFLYKDNFNFLKLVKIFNGNFGSFISSNIDDTVYNMNTYDEVFYDNNTGLNTVYNYSFDGVYNLENGIVTKIVKNSSNLYDITIKGYDGYNYTYYNLETIDYHIYNYVGNNDIIGLSKYDDTSSCFSFLLKIEKEGVSYDYYKNAKN